MADLVGSPEAMQRELGPGFHFCHRCNRTTRWSLFRGVQRCDECTDRFPCSWKGCGHVDCGAARKSSHQEMTT